MVACVSNFEVAPWQPTANQLSAGHVYLMQSFHVTKEFKILTHYLGLYVQVYGVFCLHIAPLPSPLKELLSCSFHSSTEQTKSLLAAILLVMTTTHDPRIASHVGWRVDVVLVNKTLPQPPASLASSSSPILFTPLMAVVNEWAALQLGGHLRTSCLCGKGNT